VAQGVGSEFKPQYCQKKEKKKNPHPALTIFIKLLERTIRVPQVVENLISNQEALSLNPSTTKKRKK
jgi:hypothetical protein